MKNENDEKLLAEVRQMHQELLTAIRFISELRQDYRVLEDKIELSSKDVMRLVGISKSTLSRWRINNVISFRYISYNQVVYSFKDLYIAIKTGRASFRGFRRIEALQRLNAYKDGLIKGYMGDNKDLSFEEL